MIGVYDFNGHLPSQHLPPTRKWIRKRGGYILMAMKRKETQVPMCVLWHLIRMCRRYLNVGSNLPSQVHLLAVSDASPDNQE